jgi:hypothetical protein
MMENRPTPYYVAGDEGLIKLISRETCIRRIDELYGAIIEAQRQAAWMGYAEMERQCDRMLEAWNAGVDSIPKGAA